jgi:hypothetical protein
MGYTVDLDRNSIIYAKDDAESKIYIIINGHMDNYHKVPNKSDTIDQ